MAEVKYSEKPYIQKTEFNIIGKKGLYRRDGLEKASGTAVFTRDVILPGMLYAKFLRCPYPNAKIKSMDTSKAKALPGVRCVMRYDDAEWKDNPMYKAMLGDWGHWCGDPLGVMVAADTEDICDEALKLVKIDWEVLPFIIDWKEALKTGAPILRPDVNPTDNVRARVKEEYGDVEKGFTEAEKIIEFDYHSDHDVYAGTEALVCVAQFKGDYLDIWVHNQTPANTYGVLSKVESPTPRYCGYGGVPANRVRVISLYHGAQMGGINWYDEHYGSPATGFPFYAMVIAKRCRRPVKFLYDGSHFHSIEDKAGEQHFKVGFKNDGTVTALKVTGSTVNSGLWIYDNVKIKNMYLENVWPWTNAVEHRMCYRHGCIYCLIESLIFDHVAGALGIDPITVAFKNDGSKGNDMAYLSQYKSQNGFPDRDSLAEVMAEGKRLMDWGNKWHKAGGKILPNGRYHGMGVMWHHEWTYHLGDKGGSCAGLMMRQDGTLSILTQHAEGGWGSQTAYSQIAADEVGLKFEDVNQIIQDNPGFAAHDCGCGGALISTGSSIIKAARQLKADLLEAATTNYGVSTKPGTTIYKAPFEGKKPEELDIKDSMVFEKANPSNTKPVLAVTSTMWNHQWSTAGIQRKPAFAWGWTRNANWDGVIPEKHYAMVRQAHFCEVEVDPETGEIEIVKAADVNDVGKAISPETVNSQQYGGAYMGYGRGRNEAVVFDLMSGVPLNDNLIDYKWFSIRDISGPIETAIVETGLGYGPYGSAGVGETSGAATTSAFLSAVYNALGKWIDDIPVTPGKVLKALGKI